MKKIILCLFGACVFLSACKDDNVSPVIDESNISLVATYNTSASTNGVYVSTINFKNYAFIADGTNGMQIIDVTAPNNPDSVSSFNTDGSANDIFVASVNNDIYAFISDYNSGYVIVDVSDVFNPQLVADINVAAGGIINTSFVDAVNEIAYIGLSTGQVSIFDLSPLPNMPTFITSISSTGTSLNGIFLSGNNLYLALSTIGLAIYDVTNPASPVQLSVYNTTGIASGVKVVQNYAYVADSYNGTLIFNVTTPSSPSLLSRIAPNGQVLGVAVNNNTLYTADNSYGVESVNISNPSSPQENGHIKLNSSASSIFYFGGYLYLAAAEGGLAILQPAN